MVLWIWLLLPVLLLIPHYWIWSSWQKPKNKKNGSLYVFNFLYPFFYHIRVVIGSLSSSLKFQEKSIPYHTELSVPTVSEISDHQNDHSIFKVFYCNVQLSFSRRLITFWMCSPDIHQQLSNKRCSQIIHMYCPNVTRLKSYYSCWTLHLISVACPVSEERYVVDIVNLVEMSRCFPFDKHYPTLDGTLGLRITATCACPFIAQAPSRFGLFSTVSNKKCRWSCRAQLGSPRKGILNPLLCILRQATSFCRFWKKNLKLPEYGERKR